MDAGTKATNDAAPSHDLGTSVALPILVGITGKRKLSPEASASVKQRLLQVFRRLDLDFPNVSKVLLTGGAYGADTIAAEILTEPLESASSSFPNWSVVVLLPFDQDLFEKDFRADDRADPAVAAVADARLSSLRVLLHRPARVLVRTLPPLRAAQHATQDIERAQIDKDDPRANATLRHEHYEQVGQCIAEAATILIAVMDGSEIANHEEANGSTARVVAYRRAGRPDDVGQAVALRSRVLRKDWGALVAPPASYVWLIEPERLEKVGGYPVTVLQPFADSSDHDAYVEPTRPLKESSWNRLKISLQSWWEGNWPLNASLIVPRAFERLHVAALERRVTEDRRPLAERRLVGTKTVPLDISRSHDPGSEIQTIRSMISDLQRHAKDLADTAFLGNALSFVAAVLCLEIFDKFHVRWMLYLYIVFFLVTCGIVLWARWARWQPLAEDYRAVNEMLRVQRVWWSAGLPNRVDHLHLQAVDPELSRIREAVRAILGWVWIRSPWQSADPEDMDWAHIRGNAAHARTTRDLERSAKAPADWIGGQIYYFARNETIYRRKVKRLATMKWSLFAGSAWLAVALCVWLMAGVMQDHVETWLQNRHLISEPAGEAAIRLILALAVTAGAILFWGWAASHWQVHGVARRWLVTSVTTAVGLVSAIGILVAIWNAAPLLGGLLHSDKPEEIREGLIVTMFVTLSAIAGAIQYVSEKWNVVAQALEYRDALGRFERAERLLAKNADPITGVPTALPIARQIVRDLAMLALAENEAWLKARRERPLSPVVG